MKAKVLASLVLTIALLLTNVAVVITPAHASESLGQRPTGIHINGTNTTTICKSSSIPSGYVIIAQGSSAACPGSFPNTWTITQPGSQEVVCKVSSIPSSYVIVAEGSSAACPGSFPNTWTIRRP